MRATGSAASAVAALLASGFFWGLTWLPLKHFAQHGLGGIDDLAEHRVAPDDLAIERRPQRDVRRSLARLGAL